MSDLLGSNSNLTGREATAGGPPTAWWVGHAIAGVVLAGLPLSWGLVTLTRGETNIWVWRGPIHLDGGAATLFACALFSAAAGLFTHAYLTCFERIKHRAASAAKAACCVALLLVIAALVYHAVV